MTQSECFQKHSLYSWVGMLWLHRFRKFFDLVEVPEYNWEVVGSSISILDMATHLRCWWGLFYCLVRVFEIPGHCEDNAYVPYLRYSGIVCTMPTYLPWPLDIWSGSPLCDLYICGLQLTFGYCSKRTTLALWLFMARHWLWSRTDLLSMWDTSTLWGQCLRILSHSITRYLIWRTTL